MIGQEKETMKFVFRIQKKSQGIREEILAGTLDVPRSWRWKEVVWKSKVLSWRKVEFSSFTDGTAIQGNRSPSLYKCQCFESWNSEKKYGRDTIHFNADASNTELLFRIIHSVNQLSIHGAVSNWSGQFGLTGEEKEQETPLVRKESATNCVLSSVSSLEVKLLVSSPRLASGSSLRRNNQDFESLSETLRFTRVASGMSYKTRPDEDDGFWTDHSIMPRIHTFRSKPTIQSKCSNSWRNNYCTSHWSSNRENSWHLWTWGCNSIITWFKDGPPVFWYPEERVGSWMNYTFPMPNSDPVRNYSLNIRKQKEANFAWHSRRLASRRLVRTPSALLPAKRPCSQRTNPATERKWKVIHSNSSHGGALSTAVSKMVTRLVRHYDQDERQPDAAIVWDAMKPVLLKAFAKQEARDFSDTEWLGLIHQGSSKTRFEYCEDSKNSLAYFRAIQGHSGGITVAPELMGHTLIPYNWKEYFFTGVVLPASNLSLRTDSFQVDRKAREDDRRSSSHLWILSGEIPMKKNPVMIAQFLKKCAVTVIGNVIRMPFIGWNYPEHKIKDRNSGKRNQLQSSYTVLCQQIASTQ